MIEDIYPFEKMWSDLMTDYERYRNKHAEKSKYGVISIIRTVLQSRGLWAISHYRYGRWANANFNSLPDKPVKILLKTLYFIGRFLIACMCKCDIAVGSRIGPGFYISNKGNVIFGAAVTGKNCTASYNITSGLGRDRKLPSYGDNVTIGCNSVVYGGIMIGNHTVICESTILSKSIPANMVVGGNPCKILKKMDKPIC